MSRGWAKASACCLQTTLSCAFLCHIVSLQYLSRSSLHRLAGLPCRLFLSYGLQLVTREVHRSSLRRLICPAQDHFICLTVLIISMTFVLSLTQMLVFLSLYVMLSILLSIFVCAAASLFCACLVSVHVSAPYVLAGSTQELYTCLFRQMARLLLKISRCLAYAAQPAYAKHMRIIKDDLRHRNGIRNVDPSNFERHLLLEPMPSRCPSPSD